MCLSNLLSILCFVLPVIFGYVSASEKCGDSMFFTPNSAYDTNRRLVLSTLASNVCSDCIQLASQGLLQNCPNQTDSFDWRGDKTLCFVRYSNSSFFSKMALEPTVTIFSTIKFQGNLQTYNRTWDALMNFMITRVGQSQYLADISPRIGFDRIYTLMQCIPGISSNDCETCILVSVRNYQRCCNGFVGGVVRKPVCFFRWDGYEYLGAFGNTQSLPPQESQPTPLPLPPPPDSRKNSTGVIVAIGVPAVIIIVLLAVGLVIWKRRRSYKTLKPQSELPF
ncbi:putative cysteine-rich receptor-like protein kinase 31 [Arabidopsis lyrata subsp. lyrata]|uniref:putative cysteine-rich receptor-like protein kinase 31 n=1 Tax=Arabidopsis lyrata subsp. lyrata TaxID=81972 RepID=UPI000A29B467|nr:putative cysteine-rich receptor-like protein kinase 31 [Arabidopsis lyrata subsp. lyrata]|eukprot:XP_020877175.1 putative cysteine-rich receptor-like protein kinase 31 [Arabidopsis lyrata subsp. lyrata]